MGTVLLTSFRHSKKEVRFVKPCRKWHLMITVALLWFQGHHHNPVGQSSQTKLLWSEDPRHYNIGQDGAASSSTIWALCSLGGDGCGCQGWMCRTVTSGHCVSGSKPNRKDMLLQDVFVILLEALGERQLFHSDIPPRPRTSHCLRRAVQHRRVSVQLEKCYWWQMQYKWVQRKALSVC